MKDVLACTVRGCRAPLTRNGQAMICGGGHAFDIARTGYVNLLQPQDRRSPRAGDSNEAVAARARLLASGVGASLIDTLVARIISIPLGDEPVIVELGSGTGDLLASLAERRAITALGIDLSGAAIEHAARRFPALNWIVANADRRLPLCDASTDVVISIHARRNVAESARVLKPGGALIVATPAPHDLQELRVAVYGNALVRHRADALIADHARLFAVIDRTDVQERRRLDTAALQDLLRSSYRAARTRLASRIEALEPMDVTFASDVVVFSRR